MVGVDLSNYQAGLNIGSLKDNGVSFAILKATEGTTYSDRSFVNHYNAAKEAGIPVGAYCFSHATNVEQARSEAAFILHMVKGKDLPLGIYMDVELDSQMALSNNQLLEVVNAFCQVIRNAGYKPGLYGSEYRTWYKIAPSKLSSDVIKWVAHYGKAPAFDCDIWQKTDQGRINGYSSNVDMDQAMSTRFIGMVSNSDKEKEPEPAPNDRIKPGMLFPPNPTVVAFQLWFNYDLNEYGLSTPVDGQKTARFFNDMEHFINEESSKMSKATVLAYQLWMNYNGYETAVDGKRTKAFFSLLKEFVNDMRHC